MSSFSCRLTLDDLQSRTCSVGCLETKDATDISDTSAIMPIRLKLLLTTLIYPAIQPGHRSGLESCRYLAPGRCLCSLFAACFRGGATISLPYLGTAHDLLCPLLTSVTRWARLAGRSVQHGTRNGSPGVNPATFDARLSDIPNTAKQRIEDFVVCCRLVPSVPSLIRLLFVSPHLCLRLLSGWRYRFPLPSASLRLRWGWPETLV